MWTLCPRCKARYQGNARRCPLDGAELVEAQDPLLGRVIDGRYVLLEKLGAGGMGTVYRAHDQADAHDVAIKLLDPRFGADPVQRKRFQGEADATKLLRHPHIVDIVGSGVDGQDLFLVMELLRGESLAARLDRGPLSPRDAMRVAREVAEALGHAHARGVIHRDIKPANIFLCAQAPRSKVLDFGVAHMRRAEKLTATGQVFGTPRYMSPEQARGERCDAASDLYSLGVTLFEMLTGETPFNGSVFELTLAHAMTPPPRLLDRSPGQPPALASLLDRLLSKNPGARLPGASALAQALDTILASLPQPTGREPSDLDDGDAPTSVTLDRWRARRDALRSAARAAYGREVPPTLAGQLAELDAAVERADTAQFLATAAALTQHLAGFPAARSLIVDETSATARL
ncbi:MAG: serine/threonine-protein kinase [Polyangiales bacterium]